MSKMNKRWIILIVVIAGIAIFSIIKVLQLISRVNTAAIKNIPSTYVFTAVDSVLFNKNLDKLKVEEVRRMPDRTPVSLFSFNEQYSITRYEIPLADTISLTNLLNVKSESSDQSNGYAYYPAYNFFLESKQIATKMPIASKVYLNLAGDSLSWTIQNDSVWSAHLLFHNLSVKYAADGLVDIFVQIREEEKLEKIPMQLLLLRRDKVLHMLLMVPGKQEVSMPPDLLYNTLINK